MSDPDYCYPPDYTVLRNKLDLRTQDDLDAFERMAVQVRAEQGCPTGAFDLAHLQAIHGHLFQDVYDWAGELRTVPLRKGDTQFQPHRYIATGMADVHRRLEAQDFLRGRTPEAFAEGAGRIIGDVNHVHPFREGNGRTQLIYLLQLSTEAGHRIDLTRLEREAWMAASAQAHHGEYEPMTACIRGAISQFQERAEDDAQAARMRAFLKRQEAEAVRDLERRDDPDPDLDPDIDL